MIHNMIETKECAGCQASQPARLTVTINSAGRNMYRWQCTVCGEAYGYWLRHAEIQADLLNNIQPFDDDLRVMKRRESSEARMAQYRERYTTERRVEKAAWLEEHNKYLKSPAWLKKRERVLKRDEHTCQASIKCDGGFANQVHHLNYDHWQNEPLFDLRAVCTPCHQEITRMDRERRGELEPEVTPSVTRPSLRKDMR